MTSPALRASRHASPTFAAVLALFGLVGLALPSSAPAQFQGELIDRPATGGPTYRAPNAIYSDALAFQNPLFQSAYRGEQDRVLARSGRALIREREFFVFLTVQGHPTPNIYELYQKAERPVERQRLRRELERLISVYSLTRRLAREFTGSLSPIDQLKAEVLALAGWELAWTEEEIEPRARVSSVDAFHLYRTEPYTFYQSSERTARIILRRLEVPEPPDPEELRTMDTEARFRAISEWQLAVAREQRSYETFLNDVRTRIEEGGMTFAEAASRFSELPSNVEGGLMPTIWPDSLAGPLDAALGELEPGEISEVVRMTEAVAILMLEEHDPERYQTFDEAKSDAANMAERRAVEFLYNRELRDVSPHAVLGDARMMDDLDWEDIIVRGDGMEIDKAEMLALFPEVDESEILFLNEGNADTIANLIAARLYVRGKARARGLRSHPMVEAGNRAAGTIVRAEAALRSRFRPFFEPAGELVETFHTDQPELFEPARRYDAVVFSVGFPERSSRDRGRQMALEMVEDFKERAERLLRIEEARMAVEEAAESVEAEPVQLAEATPVDAEDAADDEAATDDTAEGDMDDAAAGDAETADEAAEVEEDTTPEVYNYSRAGAITKLTNLIADYQFADIYMTAAQPGYSFPVEIQPYSHMVRGLEEGQWSEIEILEDRVAVAYILGVETLRIEPFEELRVYVADELAWRNKTVLLSRLLDAAMDEEALSFEF